MLAGKAYFMTFKLQFDTAQKLYEKNWPRIRSDCEYLPPNQYGDRMAILSNLAQSGWNFHNGQ